MGQGFSPLLQLERPLTDDAQVFSFTDESGITLLFKEKTEARIFLLDTDFNLVNSFEVTDLPEEDEMYLLGFTNREDALHICYLSRIDYEYKVVSIQKNNGYAEMHNLDAGRTRPENIYWGTFTHEGTLHILRMPKNSGMIRLSKFEGSKQFYTLEYPVKKSDFFEKTKYKLTRVNHDVANEISDTYPIGKMYVEEDRVYMTLEETDSTHIISLDLTSGQMDEMALISPSFAFSEDYVVSYKTNSLIYNGNLFQVAANQDSIKISIRSLDTQQQLQGYAYGKFDEIDICQDSLIQITDSGEKWNLSNTEELLNLIDEAPHIALSIQPLSDTTVEMCVGGVKPTQTRGVSGIILEEKAQTTYFKSFLDINDFASVSPPSILAGRRILPHHRRMRKRKLPTKFEWNDVQYEGYYDSRAMRYVIREK